MKVRWNFNKWMLVAKIKKRLFCAGYIELSVTLMYILNNKRRFQLKLNVNIASKVQ